MGTPKQSKKIVIWEKYNYHCSYCGCELTYLNRTIDHIIPKIYGGTNSYKNLFPSCKKCNESKSDRSIEEYRNFLAIKINEIFISGTKQRGEIRNRHS